MKNHFTINAVYIRHVIFILLLLAFENSAIAQTYTFVTCSATGSAGPSPLQVTNTYSATNLSGLVTSSNGIQYWTVPTSGGYRIEARGAKGYGTNAGRGASIAGDFTLTAGQVIKILVGQQGAPPISPGTNQYGGGGGSFVTYTNNTALIVAGGGGGSWAQSQNSNSDGTVAINGNSGMNGPTNGAGGVAGGGGGTASSADGGGGITGNGSGTTGGQAFVNGGLGGALRGHGGFGGGGGASSYNNRRSGGGGGYSGGGGAGSTTSGYPEGGGGGSYNGGVNQTNVSGTNAADGTVIITKLCNIVLGTTSGNNMLCQGSAITVTTDAISNYTWSTGSNAAFITESPSVTTSYTLTAMSPSNCVTSAVITITVSGTVPQLTITPSTNSVCLSNSVSISVVGAITYTFSGGINNGVPFSPVATTGYTIQGQNGCGITTSVTTIVVAPLPVAAISSASLLCVGATATLSGGGATSYTWQPGNLIGASVLVNPQMNTTFTVTGVSGNCTGNNTVSIATNPNPTINVTVSSITICLGESATITATGASSYTWTPVNLNGSSIVVTPTAPTAYNVVGENSFGCTSNASQPVIPYAGPNMNVAASNTLVCAGGTVTLNSSGATTYLWNTGATTAITTATPSGTTVYTVVGNSPNTPCSTTKTIQIDVFTPTLVVSQPTSVCLGESVVLNASGANTYNWSNGGMGSSINVSPSSTTGYTVNGVSSMGSSTCASSAVTQVTVNPLPTVMASSSRTNICKGETTTLTASGASTYSWNTTATSYSVAVSPTVQTTYSVVGTDANGCKNSSTILIRVHACVGLEENMNNSNSIQVYPNPSYGEFTVISSEAISLILINELGQVVKEIECDAEKSYTTEVKGLSKGVYFITSKNASLHFYKKIIVQ